MDGLQTPSGMETPSGMASVVSTVAGGLETPDFLELRKNSGRAQSEAVDSGPRSLYQVVPEKQTSVRGLMGSERGYDVSAVANAGAAIPVLGDERGTKVCTILRCHMSEDSSLWRVWRKQMHMLIRLLCLILPIAQGEWRRHIHRCVGIAGYVGRRAAPSVRAIFAWLCWCAGWWKRRRRLFRYDC